MTDTLTVKEETNPKASGGKFTCPMHTEIVRDAIGTCPICGMNLVSMQPTDIEKKKEYFDLISVAGYEMFTVYWLKPSPSDPNPLWFTQFLNHNILS